MSRLDDANGTWTDIAGHSPAGVTVRGHSLEDELIGQLSYTEMLALSVLDRRLDAHERRMLDACMVALMEGGLNLSTIVTRLFAETAPGEAQAAMAAGLLTVGDVYVGSVQGCAELLVVISSHENPDEAASDVVRDSMRRNAKLAGLGHGKHATNDPRAARLIGLAEEWGCAGGHLDALRLLRSEAEKQLDRPLVVNVTGAVAATLLDLGFPAEAIRPIATAARAGGLVSHLIEEQDRPIAKGLWKYAHDFAPYRGRSSSTHHAEHDTGKHEDES